MKLVLCFFLGALANATTIYIGSNAFDTTNNSGHPTVDLMGRLALPGSMWISDESTGDYRDADYFSPTDVTFSTTFNLDGTITSANLIVLAGDISSVALNGHSLQCCKGPIGHLADVFTFAALSPYLVDGSNTLTFGVVRVDGPPHIDFAGTVTTARPVTTSEAETPEPEQQALTGAGLLLLAVLLRRKQSASGNLKQDAR